MGKQTDTDPGPRDQSSSDAPTPTTLERLHIWQVQAVRDVLLVAAVIALFWAGYALRAVTVPLLVALLLAYLFEPLISWMVRHPKLKFNRPKAVGALLGSVGVVLVLTIALTLPLAVGQSMRFVSNLRDGSLRLQVSRLSEYLPEQMRSPFDDILETLPAGKTPLVLDVEPEEVPVSEVEDDGAPSEAGAEDPADAAPLTEADVHRLIEEDRAAQRSELKEILLLHQETVDAQRVVPAPDDGTGGFLQMARRSGGAVMGVLGAVLQIGLLAFLIPFYFFFFSVWYPDVLHFGGQLIPEKKRERSLDLLAKMDHVVAGFVRGRIVISLIMGIMLAIGWAICSVPYSVALGIIVGIFCAVPYLGGIGVPLAVGLLFFDQLGLPAEDRGVWLGWWGVVLWPSLVFGIVQTIEGYVLTPMIAGKATKLDPVTIVVVVLAGGSVMGVYGMLLAIPVAACGKILLTEIVLPRIKEWTRGETQDPLPISRE